MWVYEKKLQYPVKVSTCNPTLAKYLMEQYGERTESLQQRCVI